MKISELLFKFYICFILTEICLSSVSPIPENLINNIEITEFRNTTITGESEIFTNEIFPSHKFFIPHFLSHLA